MSPTRRIYATLAALGGVLAAALGVALRVRTTRRRALAHVTREPEHETGPDMGLVVGV